MAKAAHLQAIMSAVDKITPTIRRINKNMGGMQKTFRDIATSSRGVLAGIGLPATVGLGAIGFGLASAARNALQYAGALQDAKDNTGMTGKAIQELGTLFEGAGVSQEEFLAATAKLNKGLADAAVGKDKGLLGLLTQLRIPLRNATGQVRGLEDVLPELADAFAKNENPAVRTRMAMEAFGKSGSRLIGVMSQGGKSLREARREMQRLGVVLSDQATQQLDDVGDSFGVLQRQVRVQFAGAFASAAPAILRATKGLQEWIAKNKDMLKVKIGGAIEKIAKAFSAWVESGGIERLGNQITSIIDSVKDFVSMLGGMGNALKLTGALILAGPLASLVALAVGVVRLVALIGAPFIKGIVQVVRAFGWVRMMMGVMSVSFLQVALAALPLLIGIGLIAGAAYLIYKNWGPISKFFKGLWKGIVETFDKTVARLSELWGGIVETIKGAVGRILELAGKLNPVALLNNLGGSLGQIAADVLLPDPMRPAFAGGGSPLAGSGALQGRRTQNDLRVRFENAPPGLRVEAGPNNTPGSSMNVDVGRRSTGSIG